MQPLTGMKLFGQGRRVTPTDNPQGESAVQKQQVPSNSKAQSHSSRLQEQGHGRAGSNHYNKYPPAQKRSQSEVSDLSTGMLKAKTKLDRDPKSTAKEIRSPWL